MASFAASVTLPTLGRAQGWRRPFALRCAAMDGADSALSFPVPISCSLLTASVAGRQPLLDCVSWRLAEIERHHAAILPLRRGPGEAVERPAGHGKRRVGVLASQPAAKPRCPRRLFALQRARRDGVAKRTTSARGSPAPDAMHGDWRDKATVTGCFSARWRRCGGDGGLSSARLPHSSRCDSCAVAPKALHNLHKHLHGAATPAHHLHS